MIDLTKENFDKNTGSGKVLLDFWASWCGPCRSQMAILNGFVDPQIKVCLINVDEQGDLAERFEITSIPTLIALVDGKEINRGVGIHDENKIKSLFK